MYYNSSKPKPPQPRGLLSQKNMYLQSFYITEPVGNNAFSYEQRTSKQLFVPSLKKISSLDEVELGTEVAFEDVTLE